jgi:hypothetical protein
MKIGPHNPARYRYSSVQPGVLRQGYNSALEQSPNAPTFLATLSARPNWCWPARRNDPPHEQQTQNTPTIQNGLPRSRAHHDGKYPYAPRLVAIASLLAISSTLFQKIYTEVTRWLCFSRLQLGGPLGTPIFMLSSSRIQEEEVVVPVVYLPQSSDTEKPLLKGMLSEIGQ